MSIPLQLQHQTPDARPFTHVQHLPGDETVCRSTACQLVFGLDPLGGFRNLMMSEWYGFFLPGKAADKYFRSSRRPTMDETIAYYREKKIGFVNFTVDAETQLGRRRIPNEEIAEAAQLNSDIMIAFASIDPHKGRMGACEARKLVEEYGVKGFKFHPTVQGFEPTDRMAWPIYEVIAEHQLPAVFHSGYSGIAVACAAVGA